MPVPLPVPTPVLYSAGAEVAKALDPVLAAIMATLARLMSAVELLGPQTKPQGVLAGGECSATPSHTHPVKLKAPEPSWVADTRLPSATEPAREETRAPAASGMPNAWLPGADGGATPSHQPRCVETAAKAKGVETPAAATVGLVQMALGDAFPALPSRPKLSADIVPTPITWAGVVTPKVLKDNENARAFVKVTSSHKPSQGKATGAGKTMRVVVLVGWRG